MAKQIYIDENGNEVLVSGTITNDNNLPHYTGTPTAGSTAEAIQTIFKVDSFTKTYSVAGNGSANFNNSFITVPIGYSIGGLLGFGTGDADCYFANCRPSDTGSYAFFITNKSATAKSNLTATCYVLFVKTDSIAK